MTPVFPCSASSIPFIAGTGFKSRRNRCLTRYDISRTITKSNSASVGVIFPPLKPIRLLLQFSGGYAHHNTTRLRRLTATGTDLEVEQDSAALDESSTGSPSEPSTPVEAREDSSVVSAPDAASTRSKRSRPVKRSHMPPVKSEELVPGAMFIGKVVSIQQFGAFVDIGAFTDGLVHVSRMSDDFVKDVNDYVTLGQEVKVRLVEVNTESGRISLSMCENDDNSKPQPRKDAPGSSQKGRPAKSNGSRSSQRKESGNKSAKFVKGQDLVGTVKNMTRSGAFVSLPEGEEGFLPTSQEADIGMGFMRSGSSLEVGQKVNVRVLRVARGQVTLTMKREEESEYTEAKVIQGIVLAATNPFVLAFRRNESISTFLDVRAKLKETPQLLMELKTKEKAEIEISETDTELPDLLGQSVASSDDIVRVTTALGSIDSVPAPVENDAKNVLESDETEILTSQPETIITSVPLTFDDNGVDEISSSDIVVGLDVVVETHSEDIVAKQEGVQSSEAANDLATVVAAEEQLVTPENGTVLGGNHEMREVSSVGSPVQASAGNANPSSDVAASSETFSTQNMSNEAAFQKQLESEKLEDQVQIKAADTTEIPTTTQIDSQNDATPSEKAGVIDITNGQTVIQSSNESNVKATISPTLVKQLREETGAGMMDCKKALLETGGDIVKAQEYLRKKGLASAEKKASRATAEGRIGAYIHDSRIGVLIEVNCETDFVSRGEIFKELVDDLAMQVAACPQVKYLVKDDVPDEIVRKEKDIEMQKEDLLSKPEQIREKIVDGRICKRLAELALLEQPFIKNDKILVKDWVKQKIATIGENIKVKRFVRYNLGEGLEKKRQDFAAEVAAQTAAKASSAPTMEPVAVTEAHKSEEKPSTVAISASLVKQLREETGAGMMDCKKALAETGGDIEKAQEYLRKKGLLAADKKSSRLDAEGRIGSYIHDSRIGVLIEVNSETDFVARGENFKALVDDLAMQVVASPQVKFVSIEDIPEDILKKEKEIEMQREDILSKPENFRERIVDGRVSKRLGELALLEQPFIKDDSVLVKDLVKQTVASLGENIRVRRFVRFTLGEELGDVKTEAEA